MQTIRIVFGPGQELELAPALAPSSAHSAQQWLEDFWHELDCEPTRASGKVLLLDKILAVTEALGYAKLSADPKLAQELATNIAQALGKTHITVDLPGLAITS